jgi:hypothetical protein
MRQNAPESSPRPRPRRAGPGYGHSPNAHARRGQRIQVPARLSRERDAPSREVDAEGVDKRDT